jgi:hypothetical protein
MKNSDGTTLTNSAHYYMECSNKGMCDRSSGTCGCFDGYTGSACQRAECPTSADGLCSGHGVCEDIKKIASNDYNNVYKLWDEHISMGCVCDGGYSGADCSERVCKTGFDPLYHDDYSNVRYSNWTYQIYSLETTSTAQNVADKTDVEMMSGGSTVYGNYSIIFYDASGEDWETVPIDIAATCDVVIAALEGLPNNVIPSNSVTCNKHDMSDVGMSIGANEFTGGGATAATAANQKYIPIFDSAINVATKFTIAFPGNPGKLKQIEINKYLDGDRPTLSSQETTDTTAWHIYPNGFSGENTDYVNDHCEGVLVTLIAGTDGFTKLGGLDATEVKLIKKCLGSSDGDTVMAAEVYNWDYGTQKNPHLIKLIDATQDATDASQLPDTPATTLCNTRTSNVATSGTSYPTGWCSGKNPPGFFVVIWYDPDSSEFRTLNSINSQYGTTTEFHVYTTTGYLQVVNPQSLAFTSTSASAISTVATNIGSFEGNAARVNGYHGNIIRFTNYTEISTVAAAGSPSGSGTNGAFYGQLDCETNPAGTYDAYTCLNKEDLVMLFNVGNFYDAAVVDDTDPFKGMNSKDILSNPLYHNMYTVKKIGRELNQDNDMSEDYRHQMVLDMNVNADFSYSGDIDESTLAWANSAATVYKFFPPTTPYNYAAECSNRGLCNKETGICECFNGHTNDNCDTQNALAV